MSRHGGVRIDVNVPAAVVADLDAAAAATGCSRATMVRLILADAVAGRTGRPETAAADPNLTGERDQP